MGVMVQNKVARFNGPRCRLAVNHLFFVSMRRSWDMGDQWRLRMSVCGGRVCVCPRSKRRTAGAINIKLDTHNTLW